MEWASRTVSRLVQVLDWSEYISILVRANFQETVLCRFRLPLALTYLVWAQASYLSALRIGWSYFNHPCQLQGRRKLTTVPNVLLCSYLKWGILARVLANQYFFSYGSARNAELPLPLALNAILFPCHQLPVTIRPITQFPPSIAWRSPLHARRVHLIYFTSLCGASAAGKLHHYAAATLQI